jgi:hypothetical protein
VSLLSTIQAVTRELGIPEPASVVGNTDKIAKQMLALALRVGDEIVQRYTWPQLHRTATITLAASTDSYALPADFDRHINRTHWDRTNTWELEGPISPQEWRWRKEGIVSTSPRRRYRVKGATSTQFFVDPTPGSGEDGEILVFEYISKSWIRPVLWESGEEFGAGSYCFYEGNYYKTTSGGTAGATPPTHTTGSASDDTVTWTYQDIAYDSFLADTDTSLIDEKVLSLGIQAAFMYQKGFQYQRTEQKFEELLKRQATALKGAPTLRLSSRRNPMFLTPASIPDTITTS